MKEDDLVQKIKMFKAAALDENYEFQQTNDNGVLKNKKNGLTG